MTAKPDRGQFMVSFLANLFQLIVEEFPVQHHLLEFYVKVLWYWP